MWNPERKQNKHEVYRNLLCIPNAMPKDVTNGSIVILRAIGA
jgi:hypothetical protein